MADYDPVSDDTPNKRRRVDEAGNGVDSQNDSSDYGDEPTEDDFTVATLPQSQGQKRKLQYSVTQFHTDIARSSTPGRTSSPQRTFATQPTQILANGTQATLPLPLKQTPPPALSSDVQVAASSPAKAASSSPAPQQHQQQPQPVKRALPTGRGSFMASVRTGMSMAPPGTGYRAPAGVRPQPSVASNFESEDDPPIDHSSDEETQGRSNLRPTAFKKTGRNLDSTPNRADHRPSVVQESPRAGAPQSATFFSDLMSSFGHKPNAAAAAAANDSVSAYGSSSRPPRPPRPTMSLKAQPINSAVRYHTIADIRNYRLEVAVKAMLETYPHETIDRCMTALTACKGNKEDAMNWLAEDEEQDAPGDDDDSSADELAPTPASKQRGVAVAKNSSSLQSVLPVAKNLAKQQVNAPSQTIAQKYQSAQAARKQSQSQSGPVDEGEDIPPRRRLQQGRRPRRSPSFPSSPPPVSRPVESKTQRKQIIAISDDEEDEAEESDPDPGPGQSSGPPEPEMSSHDEKLLKFFNTCTIQDLMDTSAQPEAIARLIVDNRPFDSLDVIRTISSAAQTTKSGKASRARPIGNRIVDDCSEMWEGYDAVDELVEECERLAKPIQDALKGWGIGPTEEGELQVMNLDDAHDSGIGTPASSTASDDVSKPTPKSKRFLGQPETMSANVRLKNYQLVGLNWLNLLWTKKLSCILADDMGLGKTCQVISFLAYLQQQNVDGVHLVIVPGSTLENWLREFAHFAPELRVVPYYGSQKERGELQYTIEAERDSIDVIVTTYDMAVSDDDNKFLRKYIDPAVCVYDEAHALRNTNSKRYRQLTRIPADFRILLTGTPLQNNLQELVAILAFIMPDMFHQKSEQLQYIFQHKATTKSSDHGALLSAQRIARARTMMTPFILRRKKQQVLDLPAKHSRVEYCDMTPDQADYYAQVVEDAQAFFASKGEAKAKNAATKKASSNVLMALRKAAIHPLLARRHFNEKRIEKMVEALLKQEFEGNRPDQVKSYLEGTGNQKMEGGSSDYSLHKFCLDPRRSSYMKKFAVKGKDPWMDSGKVKRFSELVQGFNKDDRLLVFSQFTSMMDILEAVLETLDIKFMRLDGSTNMQVRQDMIDQFTNDESITVFMLSTKAGGAGINLAAANKVIIFDAGFNPQDDIQAENRAHRVGQTRDVEVVRLVTRGTIEEQIHALGESKLALDERVAGEGTAAAAEEKRGEDMVQKMFLDALPGNTAGDEGKGGSEEGKNASKESADLKDAFKTGMEGAGVKIASKQAQF